LGQPWEALLEDLSGVQVLEVAGAAEAAALRLAVTLSP